jgi:hypothetical protein
MSVTMTVLRDGYWDGQYPRAGDTITVDPAVVDPASLELAGFAIRQAADAPDQSKPTKGSHAHGTGTSDEVRKSRGR